MTMSESDWHSEAPTPEAYSRVTNPERFRPLHTLALALVDRLTADYDVARTDAFALLPGMQSFEHARAPVTLTPLAPDAAPVAIAFTTFPSLIVRYGRWLADPFPACGCDACGETAAGEGERLEGLLRAVAAGHFREELTIPVFGEARLRWALGDIASHAGHSGWRTLPRGQARTLRSGGPRRVQWQPWPRRGLGAAANAPAV
jgi:hypothetical protein